VNGVPVNLHGAVTIRSNPNDSGESQDTVFAREIRLLKEGNINALRSHTSPLEEEFLTLCDRYGFYVMPDIPYVWVMEDDFRYLTDDLVRRAQEVFEAQRNHPSVILWHVGNENSPTTAYLGGGQASRWLNAHDPTRPVAVCRNLADAQELGTQISDLHYDPMTHPEFREPYPKPLLFGEFHAVPEEIARLKDKGFVETWGRSLQREWSAFRDRTSYVVGGFICCWEDGALSQDLGVPQWGVVDSKRQAKPVHYEIRNVFAPVGLALEDPVLSGGRLSARLKVTNRYNFTDLDGFKFQWRLLKGAQEVSSGREALHLKPGTTFFFPLSLAAPGGADRLRISIQDAAGNSTQDEEFLLPDSSSPASLSDFLKELGVGETSPLAFDLARNETHTGAYRARWHPAALHPSVRFRDPDGVHRTPEIRGGGGQGGARIQIQSRAGEDLVTLNGLAMQAEESARSDLLSGSVQYQPAEKQGSALSIPFVVTGGTKDKKRIWKIPGALRTEFGEAWIRVSYTLEPDCAVSFPEAGVRLLLAHQSSSLSWNRDALWSVPAEGWADHSLELHVPLETLRETVSKRNVYWATLEDGAATLLIVPLSASSNLSVGNTEIILSDFLSAGNFLGKFDRDTVQKTLSPGETFRGGFVMYFLSKQQKAKFAALTDSKRDLTWARRVKPVTH
jgi:hypothetical protein